MLTPHDESVVPHGIAQLIHVQEVHDLVADDVLQHLFKIELSRDHDCHLVRQALGPPEEEPKVTYRREDHEEQLSWRSQSVLESHPTREDLRLS